MSGGRKAAGDGAPVLSAAREPLVLHASCVEVATTGGPAGLLILGPSGAGKSSLSLMLMAWGARLVADDNLLVHRQGDQLVARPHPTTAGLIEARGVGILTAPASPEAILSLAVDLGQMETDRLPPERLITLLGVAVPLVLGPASPHLAAALLHLLRNARHA